MRWWRRSDETVIAEGIAEGCGGEAGSGQIRLHCSECSRFECALEASGLVGQAEPLSI